MPDHDDVVLPDGLWICSTCGEARGHTWDLQPTGRLVFARSRCLCEGIRCRRCGRGMIRKPAEDFYSWRAGKWLHLAWYGYRAPCEFCDPERHG